MFEFIWDTPTGKYTRKFKNLGNARKAAHKLVGEHPERTEDQKGARFSVYALIPSTPLTFEDLFPEE